jgi:Flp pilus assembly protein TadD
MWGNMKTLKGMGLAVITALAVAGCGSMETDDLPFGNAQREGESTSSTFGSGPEQVWIEKAKENFRHGEYGLAERYFRRAIEERHSNAEAWLGLAASYDHLKRFDEADRAYDVLQKMAGTTPQILNNLGYHYMLKGDFAAAERALRTAQSQDPKNPSIQANLALLAEWKANAGKS